MSVAKLAAVLLAVARWLQCSRSCLGGCLIAMLSALAYEMLSSRLLAMAAICSWPLRLLCSRLLAVATMLSAANCGCCWARGYG